MITFFCINLLQMHNHYNNRDDPTHLTSLEHLGYDYRNKDFELRFARFAEIICILSRINCIYYIKIKRVSKKLKISSLIICRNLSI